MLGTKPQPPRPPERSCRSQRRNGARRSSRDANRLRRAPRQKVRSYRPHPAHLQEPHARRIPDAGPNSSVVTVPRTPVPLTRIRNTEVGKKTHPTQVQPAGTRRRA
jgi:hypothetical protein